VAAYRALLDDGVPARQIVLAGESAGGGLAVAATVAIGGAGLPRPAAVYAASPWADLTTSGDSMAGKAEVDPSVTSNGVRRRARDYAAGHDLADPGLSPLFADLSGFPPLLIQAGGNEVLLDDATRFATHAAPPGVGAVREVVRTAMMTSAAMTKAAPARNVSRYPRRLAAPAAAAKTCAMFRKRDAQ
jgi:epsilon-lactone hydrolase